MTLNARRGLAALAGVLLALCFPRFDLWWLALVALLPLLLALQMPGRVDGCASPRRAFRLGWIAGTVFFAILLYWLPNLPPENLTVPFLMYPALLLLALFYGLFPGAACWATAYLGRRGAPVWLVFPGAWVLAEWLRSLGFMGFTWGVLGYAMAPVPHLIQFAAWTGVWGVSLWLAAVSSLIHAYFSQERAGAKLVLGVLFLAAVFAPRFHGQSVLTHRPMTRDVKVGVVQPNTGKNKWDPGVRDSVVAGLLHETRKLSGSGAAPDLVVWPETAVPARLPREQKYLSQVRRVVEETGVPLLAGYPDGVRRGDEWSFTNSAGLMLPGRGIVQQYDKRHLVPFSEYSPIPIMKRVDFGQANFSQGDTLGIFPQLSQPFGVLICFESGFSDLSRELVRAGARYLVNITNDQWFGDSAAPYQHFNFNVLRCIENRVGMARAANTGISGVIDSYGVVRMATPTFVADSRVVSVELGTRGTFYTRHGDWPLGLALGLLASGIAVAWIRRARP